MPAEQYKKLDTFEAHALSKADKVYAGKDYKRAAAEYNSFMLEFPRSQAVAYALLRKARSLQQSNKRNAAIREYTMVVDYFPNQVRYAAAATFYKALSYWENGDEAKAYATWAKMVKDKGYAKHPLAAEAYNRLAAYLKKKDQLAKAIEYQRRVAVDFRKTHPGAARDAIGDVATYYIKLAPDEPKLRAFYKDAQTFEHHPRTIPDQLAADWRYWQQIRHRVRRHGRYFDEDAAARRESFFRYWADQLEGKFPKSDEVGIDLAYFRLQHEKDRGRWIRRIDELYHRNGQADDYGRTIRFIALLAEHGQKAKAREYVGKLDFAKMNNDQVRSMLLVAYDKVRDADLGRVVFDKLDLQTLSDDAKAELAGQFWKRDAQLVERLCASISDRPRGQMELLRFYAWADDAQKGLALAETLTDSPRFAAETWMIRADLLAGQEKYKEAIAAYRSADQPPESLWKIVDCQLRLGNQAAAIGQLREIENFFKSDASRAALAIAHVFRDAKQRKQYVAALRAVGKKYPKSPQSRRAHLELEAMGYKVTGGLDAEE